MHIEPGAQEFAQVPQFIGSFCRSTQLGPHAFVVGPHTQAPAAHVPPGPQPWPHAPQLSALVVRSVQTPLQTSIGAGQVSVVPPVEPPVPPPAGCVVTPPVPPLWVVVVVVVPPPPLPSPPPQPKKDPIARTPAIRRDHVACLEAIHTSKRIQRVRNGHASAGKADPDLRADSDALPRHRVAWTRQNGS